MSEGSPALSVAPDLVVTVGGAGRTPRGALCRARRYCVGRYCVGRDPETDIVVAGPRVSWNHAVLQADGNAWFIEDRGSRDGTFVGTDPGRPV